MGWVSNHAARYRACNSTQAANSFGTYTNTTGSAVRITSITIHCGTLNGHCQSPISVDGVGNPIKIYLIPNGDINHKSEEKSVTAKVKGSGTGAGSFPVSADMQYITLNFPVKVGSRIGPGQSWAFNMEFLGNAANAGGSRVFCWDCGNVDSYPDVTVQTEPWQDTPTTVTATFDANGGKFSDGTTSKTVTVNSGSTPTAPGTPTKAGFTFGGWSPSIGPITTNTTYKANWGEVIPDKGRITWATDVGQFQNGSSMISQAHDVGSVIYSAPEEPTDPVGGRTFDHWNPAPPWTVENDTWVYAMWGEAPPKEYTVTFDLNGGVDWSGTPLTQIVQEGGSAQAPRPSRDGYDFQGWNTNAWMYVTSDVYAVAQWKIKQYYIYYYPNGGSGSTQVQIKNHGDTVSIYNNSFRKSVRVTFDPQGGSVSPAYQDREQNFSNWDTSPNGMGQTWWPGDRYSTNENMSLYAQWQSTTIGTLPTPTMADAFFQGWFDTRHGGGQASPSQFIDSDITLYAYWNYKVFYHANGGECDLETQIKEYDLGLTLHSYILERKGYRFLGWATNANATTAQYRPGGVLTNNAVTHLYAVWEKATFTVTFDLGIGEYTGGSALIQHVTLGGSATPPNTPTHATRKFFGWSGDYRNVDSDRTIYAMWKASWKWRYNGKTWERFY